MTANGKENRLNPQYDAGYNKAMSKIKHLDDKYSLMWAEANTWRVPSKLSMPAPSINDTPERLFVSGCFAVLEALRKDSLLTETIIDKYWQKLTGVEHDR